MLGIVPLFRFLEKNKQTKTSCFFSWETVKSVIPCRKQLLMGHLFFILMRETEIDLDLYSHTCWWNNYVPYIWRIIVAYPYCVRL